LHIVTSQRRIEMPRRYLKPVENGLKNCRILAVKTFSLQPVVSTIG
jgi:hypothetical protein